MPARVCKSINIEIGARIQSQRKAHGWTREQLAELAGYSVSFIHEIERGRSGLSSESMKRLSEVFDVSADFLLNGDVTIKPQVDSMTRKLQSLNNKELLYLDRIIDAYIESHQ